MSENQIKTTDLYLAKSIDQTNRFSGSLNKLMELLGVFEAIKIQEGMLIKTYTEKVTLANGTVEEGEIIPLSKVEVKEGTPIIPKLNKYRKATTGEAIQRSGSDLAISKTDSLLLGQVQKNIRTTLTDGIKTATTTVSGVKLQGALAKALAAVQIKFDGAESGIIGFINPNSLADYQATHTITLEKEFGLSYLTNFLGFDKVLVLSDIPEGEVYATASSNLEVYVIDPNGSDLGKAFNLTSDSTGFVGMTHFTSHEDLTSQTLVVSSVTFAANRLDGVVKSTITPSV